MLPGGASLLLETVRYAPLRTAVFSVGPPLWGVAQLVNAYLHGGALLSVGAFAVVMTAFAVLVTRYHVATYRRTRLSERVSRYR